MPQKHIKSKQSKTKFADELEFGELAEVVSSKHGYEQMIVTKVFGLNGHMIVAVVGNKTRQAFVCTWEKGSEMTVRVLEKDEKVELTN